MDELTIIGWPDIQYYMDKEGFDENSTLINPNLNIGIDISTYLVNVQWMNQLNIQ